MTFLVSKSQTIRLKYFCLFLFYAKIFNSSTNLKFSKHYYLLIIIHSPCLLPSELSEGQLCKTYTEKPLKYFKEGSCFCDVIRCLCGRGGGRITLWQRGGMKRDQKSRERPIGTVEDHKFAQLRPNGCAYSRILRISYWNRESELNSKKLGN